MLKLLVIFTLSYAIQHSFTAVVYFSCTGFEQEKLVQPLAGVARMQDCHRANENCECGTVSCDITPSTGRDLVDWATLFGTVRSSMGVGQKRVPKEKSTKTCGPRGFSFWPIAIIYTCIYTITVQYNLSYRRGGCSSHNVRIYLRTCCIGI